jgi:hypothetical protein
MDGAGLVKSHLGRGDDVAGMGADMLGRENSLFGRGEVGA